VFRSILAPSIKTLLIGFSLAASAGTVAAATPEEQASSSPSNSNVTVYYGDLNLQDDIAAAAMLKRLRSAASNVCGRASLTPVTYFVRTNHRPCRDNAVQAAIARVDQPALTALYNRSRTNPM